MPARQYDDAFAILEKSFNDSSFLRAYQSLPVRKHVHATPYTKRPSIPTFSSAATITTNQDGSAEDSDDDASDGSMHEGFGTKASINPVSLPPTPPTRLEPTAQRVQEEARLATPVHRLRPPTPDLTPPAARTRPLQPKSTLDAPRPTIPHFPSSQADSFVTAREDPIPSSAQTSQLSLPLADTLAGRNWLDTTRHMRLGELGLAAPDRRGGQVDKYNDGTNDDEDYYGNITPTKDRPELSFLTGREDDDMTPEIKSETTHLPTGVTVRRKRYRSHLNDHLLPQNGGQPLREEINKHTNPQPRQLGTTTAHGDQNQIVSVQDDQADWQTSINDMLYKAMRDEKSKRLSGNSQTSTTLEAMVIAAPEKEKRTLRRAGKNLALREDLSLSRSSSLASASAVTKCHSLRHKKAHIPNRLHLRDDSRVTSNPEPYHKDRIQVIVIPKRRSSLDQTYALQPHVNDKMHLLTYKQHRLHHTANNAISRAGIESVDDKLGSDKDHSKPDVLTLRHVSAPLPHTSSPRTPTLGYFQHSNGSQLKLDLSPKTGWKRNSSHDSDLDSPLSEQPPPPSPSLHPAKSLDHHTGEVTPNQSPNKASGNPGYMPFTPPRSEEQSLDNSQNYHARRASESDHTDTADIIEAQAISLYPHGNHSLKVVQHRSSSLRAKARGIDTMAIDEVSTPTESDNTPTEAKPLRPIFAAPLMDAPRTPSPPQRLSGGDDEIVVDSPLCNPRPAPMPPVIVIPPTPVPAVEDQMVSGSFNATPKLGRPKALERRPSLVQRARRYSESFIQPLFPLSRTDSRRSSSRRPTDARDRASTLHPFWRPRGFWDDFSDDSEFEDYDNTDPRNDRLPAGGDTSDVTSLKQRQKLAGLAWPRKMSVRMPGFMGKGGFLVGNSLGIDRHGTNNRRHQVSIPKGASLKSQERLVASGGERGQKRSNGRLHRSNSTPTPSSSPPSLLPFFTTTTTITTTMTSPSLRKKRSSRDLADASRVHYSTESLRQRAAAAGGAHSSHHHHHNSLKKRTSQRRLRRSRYNIPGFKDVQMRVLSVGEIRDRLEERKMKREERRREVWRRQMKGRIGSPRMLDGISGGGGGVVRDNKRKEGEAMVV